MSDTALRGRTRRLRPGLIPAIIGAVIVLLWGLAAILAPALAPHPPGAILRLGQFAGIEPGAPLGTDMLGRDMLSRVIYGARFSLGVPLVAAGLASSIGVVLGILAAIRPGAIDGALSRIFDALISIPHLMFALVIVAALGASMPVLIGVIAFSYAPGAFRVARALALDIQANDYVTVARARGEGLRYIILREVLPNMWIPVLTDFGLRFVFSVLLLSGLSFLGVGIQPPNADWGALVRENIEGVFEAAPAVVVPALAIATLTVGVNLIIDGLAGRRRRASA